MIELLAQDSEVICPGQKPDLSHPRACALNHQTLLPALEPKVTNPRSGGYKFARGKTNNRVWHFSRVVAGSPQLPGGSGSSVGPGSKVQELRA